MKNPKLSIIILNYNTKELLSDCLHSLEKVKSEINFEVIVSDNDSTDGSLEMVMKDYPWVRTTKGPNISFSSGNNRAKGMVKGNYVLLLNSDTIVKPMALSESVNYMEEHADVGALTCKLVLKDGSLDKDVRRRFPTPWISFKRLFLKNGREYWYEDVDENKIHEVEAIQGAFFLTKKDILDRVGWLDEKYLFDGEDLDLSYQIRKAGYKIVYYPKVSIIHLKGASKGKIKDVGRSVDKKLRIKKKMEGVDSMEYFYRKNLWSEYPIFFNWFVLLGIKFLKMLRYLQIVLKKD